MKSAADLLYCVRCTLVVVESFRSKSKWMILGVDGHGRIAGRELAEVFEGFLLTFVVVRETRHSFEAIDGA